MKTAIVTDSNSGISQEKANKYGIYVLPMPFYVDDELYFEDRTMSHEEFYIRQQAGSKIYSSQPSPADVTDLWDKVLEEYDEILYIPMSSGLSGSCATAMAMAQDYENRVIVADIGRVSVTQKLAVLEAKKRANAGMTAAEILKELVYAKDECIIFLTVEDLKYLKQGGRISASSAAIGSLLNIKPILTLGGDKVEAVGKVRGDKLARKKIMQCLDETLVNKFHTDNIDDFYLAAAASMSEEDALVWKQQLEEHFSISCSMSPIPLSMGCHLGHGTYGAALIRKMPM
ncbi:MAG: DegV family protein [bacterium]|nr:DegV family protein [bacterium]